jgi:predicted nucleotidyltransferase
VAEESIFTKKEIKFLKELTKNKVEFILVGLAAATLQGAPVVTQDIDLWFKNLQDPNLQKALKAVKGGYIEPIMLNPPMFYGDNIKMFDIVVTLSGLEDFNTELKNTTEIKLEGCSVKILKLERIIKSKKTANRKKDQLSVPVLEDTLATLKTLNKKRADTSS